MSEFEPTRRRRALRGTHHQSRGRALPSRRRRGGDSREKVWHPGAVGILAVDDTSTCGSTRQPREVAGLENSLEIPAGKLDVPGEAPLATAKRELAEEIGKQAASWHELMVFYTSPGFSDERVWLFLATELSRLPARADPRRTSGSRSSPGP
jgi:8-oxo-dGTP pyrophosphatase MutT (NUDIX family)